MEHIRSAGATLIIQATDMEEARRAVDLGADVIVAQGTASGGHGARNGRSTLPFVPAVVDLATPVPVLAAGGIADGRGVAAGLALGAEGALIGTRFQATTEALLAPGTAQAIVEGRGEDTERNRVLDIARSSRWPSKYTARTLGHPYLDAWRGREDELAAAPHAQQAYQEAVVRGEPPRCPGGRARPSTSSTTCRPRSTWSAPWPHRPRKRCPGQAGAAEQGVLGLAGRCTMRHGCCH
ncbi:nitronate monooxygenase [Streptomyces sp. NPDC057600]|uniref:nitronate monooxygenase n=1 Tax=Streptomyces sp. NPDC057600 TaxID=3346180 RepID=UPI0036B710B5